MARSRSLVNSLDPHRANDAALFTVNSERIPRIPRSLGRTVHGCTGNANCKEKDANDTKRKPQTVTENHLPWRHKKTLGWFLNDFVERKNMKENTENGKFDRRNCGFISENRGVSQEQIKETKTSRYRLNKQHRLINSTSEKKKHKNSKHRSLQKDRKTNIDDKREDGSHQKGNISRSVNGDYWSVDLLLFSENLSKILFVDIRPSGYYDTETDGYYYQHRGSRGWRKRAPSATETQAQRELIKLYGPFQVFFGVPTVNAYIMKRYYDAESDGYYFEMPSVDGWKKRKPLVQQKPAVNPPLKTNGILVNKEEENPLHRISYGEAPARGHLPPAYIVSMMDFMHQDPFPRESSADSTLSSFSEDTANSPINDINHVQNMLYNSECLDGLVAKYDVIEEETKESDNLSNFLEHCFISVNSQETENLENEPPVDLESVLHSRPDSLNLMNNDDFHNKIIMNFNAERFIADLNFSNLYGERVLRDLASLKTPFELFFPFL
ncbi:unnamed protein product [Dracunculus medinensis]|uniref:HSF_DOMAIN domain-containing protein n=1 Tax=Dracunculus medinensis TaxID=318479 RepID=A0A0N4U0F7_DRAME|nr:unnamed protein product [Dracunculus medinensis]